MKPLLLFIISLYVLFATATAQTSNSCSPLVANIINAKTPDDRDAAIGTLVKLGNNPLCFAEIVAKSSQGQKTTYVAFLKNLELHRTDTQTASSTGTGGTTSLVSKGVTAQVISVAAEYGALTESVNNKVVTIQGSLNGFLAALIRQSLVQYCAKGVVTNEPCVHQSLLDALRRISYGVSFNTSTNSQAVTGMVVGSQSGTAQPVTFTPAGNQISAATGKVVLWNARDATSSTFQTQWKNALTTSGGSVSPTLLSNAGATLLSALESLIPPASNQIYTDWEQRAYAALKTANNTDLTTIWQECSAQLVDLMQGKSTMHQCDGTPKEFTKDEQKKFTDPDLVSHALSFVQASSEYRLEEDEFVTAIADKPVMTLEYDYNQALDQIPTSTVRLIFDKGIGKSWSITANGAFALYDSPPSASIPGGSRLRNAQFGVETDRKLQALSFLGAATLDTTYYFQYQNSPSILNVTPSTPLTGITLTGLPSTATQVFAKKGNLHIAQLKIALGTGATNVRFPVAVSYSSRTELLTKPEWRGQVGVSYDFDSLFMK
jgi:hypothetical protein